jgi:hypothetical protein
MLGGSSPSSATDSNTTTTTRRRAPRELLTPRLTRTGGRIVSEPHRSLTLAGRCCRHGTLGGAVIATRAAAGAPASPRALRARGRRRRPRIVRGPDERSQTMARRARPRLSDERSLTAPQAHEAAVAVRQYQLSVRPLGAIAPIRLLPVHGSWGRRYIGSELAALGCARWSHFGCAPLPLVDRSSESDARGSAGVVFAIADRSDARSCSGTSATSQTRRRLDTQKCAKEVDTLRCPRPGGRSREKVRCRMSSRSATGMSWAIYRSVQRLGLV